MKRICFMCALLALMIALGGCSFIDSWLALPTPEIDYVRKTPEPENTQRGDDIVSQLFPNGIKQTFRDAYTLAQSDETMSGAWNVYYASVSQEAYWDYLYSLITDKAYKFDILNSDRLCADMLLKSAAYSQFPSGGVLCAALDDPSYAYLRVYYYDTETVNPNGFAYTMRVNITLYDVPKDFDGIPDNSASKGSVMGMDEEKADEVFFASDSEEYIVTQEQGTSYGGFESIAKYSFNNDGKLITKKVRLTFNDEWSMLLWCYDALTPTDKPLYAAIDIAGNTVYAAENLSLSYKQVSFGVYDADIDELERLFEKGGIGFYRS
ncbi:MAG: hypothetical protein IJO48_00200 [Clostridia bacterium]|nr:hypothetical protein [Clostridia bacterium]